MTTWRQQALAEIPGLKGAVEAASDVMALWIDLYLELREAYARAPVNEEQIRGIYSYAFWALRESHDGDAITAVLVGFFEHVPTEAASRQDMHRWIEPDLFRDLGPTFKYFLSDQEYWDLQAEYKQKRKAWRRRRAARCT